MEREDKSSSITLIYSWNSFNYTVVKYVHQSVIVIIFLYLKKKKHSFKMLLFLILKIIQ